MKLIVGLGNPGKLYEKNRHNIGFRIVDALGELGNDVMILKPMDYMNNSGKAVAKEVKFYKLDPSNDILIISDDKDMIFGKLRERSEGSAGGHNGLKSIIAELGTENFHRLKFGVGHEDQSIPTDAFVLQNFSEEEEGQLPELIREAAKKVEDWLRK
jgi:PTH1 family peptidyl-tRNA hydrolase